MRLTHKDIEPYLTRLVQDFHQGSSPDVWYRQPVTLEVCTGELAENALKTMAILGRAKPVCKPIKKTDRFKAQGLEGKVAIRKDFFSALMNMRDLIPEHRGQIIL